MIKVFIFMCLFWTGMVLVKIGSIYNIIHSYRNYRIKRFIFITTILLSILYWIDFGYENFINNPFLEFFISFTIISYFLYAFGTVFLKNLILGLKLSFKFRKDNSRHKSLIKNFEKTQHHFKISVDELINEFERKDKDLKDINKELINKEQELERIENVINDEMKTEVWYKVLHRVFKPSLKSHFISFIIGILSSLAVLYISDVDLLKNQINDVNEFFRYMKKVNIFAWEQFEKADKEVTGDLKKLTKKNKDVKAKQKKLDEIKKINSR